MSDTTALNGDDIDAVAASLIEGPSKDDEQDDEALVQSNADDAQDQPDATDDDAEDADQADVDPERVAGSGHHGREDTEPVRRLGAR